MVYPVEIVFAPRNSKIVIEVNSVRGPYAIKAASSSKSKVHKKVLSKEEEDTLNDGELR